MGNFLPKHHRNEFYGSILSARIKYLEHKIQFDAAKKVCLHSGCKKDKCTEGELSLYVLLTGIAAAMFIPVFWFLNKIKVYKNE